MKKFYFVNDYLLILSSHSSSLYWVGLLMDELLLCFLMDEFLDFV